MGASNINVTLTTGGVEFKRLGFKPFIFAWNLYGYNYYKWVIKNQEKSQYVIYESSHIYISGIFDVEKLNDTEGRT